MRSQKRPRPRARVTCDGLQYKIHIYVLCIYIYALIVLSSSLTGVFIFFMRFTEGAGRRIRSTGATAGTAHRQLRSAAAGSKRAVLDSSCRPSYLRNSAKLRDSFSLYYFFSLLRGPLLWSQSSFVAMTSVASANPANSQLNRRRDVMYILPISRKIGRMVSKGA